MQHNQQVLKIPENSFDFIRIFATWMVATSHFFAVPAYDEYASYVGFFVGFEVILTFFMLSSMLLVGSYLRAPDLKTYFIKRFSRIYPAYIVMILLLWLGLSAVSTLSMQEYFTHPDTYKYLAANLVFLNFLQPTLPGVFEESHAFTAVNGSLWTLKIEFAFYFILPVVVWILSKMKSMWVKNLILLLIYLSASVYEYWFVYLFDLNDAMRHSLIMQFPSFMHVFAVGVFLYYNFDWIKRHLHILWIPMVLCLAENALSTTYFFFPIGLGILLFIIGFQIPKLGKLVGKNDYSYGLYIYHYPVIQLLIEYDYIRSYPIWSYVLFLLLTFALAYLSWHFVEKPLLKSSRYKKV